MLEEQHEGWTNWETWNINLWLTSDEGLYNKTKKLLKGEYNFELERENALIKYVLELFEKNIITDDICIQRVNWKEIIKSFDNK
jgi:hypothetical protein